MSVETKKTWAAPSLEAIDMLDTAAKGAGPNESCKDAAGPGKAQKCS